MRHLIKVVAVLENEYTPAGKFLKPRQFHYAANVRRRRFALQFLITANLAADEVAVATWAWKATPGFRAAVRNGRITGGMATAQRHSICNKPKDADS